MTFKNTAAVHLNTLKALTSLCSKRFVSFRYSFLVFEKDKIQMYKLSRQELYNNISYNNDVITTTLQHVEKNDIVTTLFRNFQANSGTFSNIQPSSGKLRDIEGYCGIFRHYRGVWSHDQKYAELCVIHACTTVKYSEPCLV